MLFAAILLHGSELDEKAQFTKPDEWIDTDDEPDHDGLYLREQQVLLDAIQNGVDLSDHMDHAVNSLGIVIAADESYKTGKSVDL